MIMNKRFGEYKGDDYGVESIVGSVANLITQTGKTLSVPADEVFNIHTVEIDPSQHAFYKSWGSRS